jgi:hypothetical protein
MRHEAAGITSQSFPKTIRLGGIDCAATYLHEPGDPKDGLTVTVPIFVLNQVNEERLRMAGAGHVERQGPGTAQNPASAPTFAPGAAAGVGAQDG